MSSRPLKDAASEVPPAMDPGRPQPITRELQQLWFCLARHPWSSLLLVPAHPGGSSLAVATGLVEVGRLSEPAGPPRLLDARRASPDTVAGLLARLGGGDATRTLVVVDPVLDVPAGLALAHATGAALLCVTLGESDLASVRRTLALCGRERFLGSVTVRRRPA